MSDQNVHDRIDAIFRNGSKPIKVPSVKYRQVAVGRFEVGTCLRDWSMHRLSVCLLAAKSMKACGHYRWLQSFTCLC